MDGGHHVQMDGEIPYNHLTKDFFHLFLMDGGNHVSPFQNLCEEWVKTMGYYFGDITSIFWCV
jgi:hypothetical protein